MTPVSVRSTFTPVAPLSSETWYMYKLYSTSCPLYPSVFICLCICIHLLETAVSICDGSFAWEKEAEPLLKKYVSNTEIHIVNVPTVLYNTERMYFVRFCQCVLGYKSRSAGSSSGSCGLRKVLPHVSPPGRDAQHQRLHQHSGDTLFPSLYLSNNNSVFKQGKILQYARHSNEC